MSEYGDNDEVVDFMESSSGGSSANGEEVQTTDELSDDDTNSESGDSDSSSSSNRWKWSDWSLLASLPSIPSGENYAELDESDNEWVTSSDRSAESGGQALGPAQVDDGENEEKNNELSNSSEYLTEAEMFERREQS